MSDRDAKIHEPANRATFKPATPYGWVQWKGTDACMDIHCACGALGHVDGDFAYRVQCDACGALYYLPGFIELVRLTPEEEADESEHGEGELLKVAATGKADAPT